MNGTHYPLVNIHIAIANGHRNSGFSHSKNVVFHSYVSLPEGKTIWYTEKKLWLYNRLVTEPMKALILMLER